MRIFRFSGRDFAANDTKAVPTVRFGTAVRSAVSAFETVGRAAGVILHPETREGSKWLELID
jgi:hypothetical protein